MIHPNSFPFNHDKNSSSAVVVVVVVVAVVVVDVAILVFRFPAEAVTYESSSFTNIGRRQFMSSGVIVFEKSTN